MLCIADYTEREILQLLFAMLADKVMAFSHGWEDLLFVSGLKTHYCGRVFFFVTPLIFGNGPKISQSVNFEQR